MQIPTSSMSSAVILGLGRFHLAALAQNAETEGLSCAFQPKHDALTAAKMAREQAEEALVGPRVAVRFAEYELERVVRHVALLAHAADNNASAGLTFQTLFPNGMNPELRPTGAVQMAASTALRERLISQPAAAAVKAQVLKDLDDALAALDGALRARQAAEQAVGQSRVAEASARAAFIAAYDANAGAIRQMFPRNRPKQDLHFDGFRDYRSEPAAKRKGVGPGRPPTSVGPLPAQILQLADPSE